MSEKSINKLEFSAQQSTYLVHGLSRPSINSNIRSLHTCVASTVQLFALWIFSFLMGTCFLALNLESTVTFKVWQTHITRCTGFSDQTYTFPVFALSVATYTTVAMILYWQRRQLGSMALLFCMGMTSLEAWLNHFKLTGTEQVLIAFPFFLNVGLTLAVIAGSGKQCRGIPNEVPSEQEC
jgi:hypothetical protein